MPTHEQKKTVIIETSMGPVIGISDGEIISFRGLRYASPPVGDRRFEMPLALTNWTTPMDCTGGSSIHQQLPSRLERVIGVSSAVQSEDCLHLDVWIPAGKKKAATLVFFHGGAFLVGGGSLPCYNGHELAKNSGCIIINISHRIGSLGFLALPGIINANLGLYDQIEALKFIKRLLMGIEGDGNKITLIGQSSGAYSISLILSIKEAQGLFQRAIIMSAPLGMQLQTVEEAEPIAQMFLNHLALESFSKKALQNVPLQELLNAQLNVLRQTAHPGNVIPPFKPLIDKLLVHEQPIQSLRCQPVSDIDLVVGTTREEMNAFFYGVPQLEDLAPGLARNAFQNLYGARWEIEWQRMSDRLIQPTATALFSCLETERLFMRPTLDLARAHARSSGRVFAYSFDWHSEKSGFGACHCLDLPFLFGNFEEWIHSPMLKGCNISEVAELSNNFIKLLVAFAETGNPTNDEVPAWPLYKNNGPVLNFNRVLSLRANGGAPRQ